jgi:chorismate dehydratase
MTTLKTIRVGAIKYINSLPLFTAFEKGGLQLHGSFHFDVPSALNRALHEQQLELSMISSAAYLANEERYTLATDKCISAEGPVMSVLLYTKCPIATLTGKVIALTAQSASSALLLKVLCKHFWRVQPRFVTTETTEEAIEHEAFLLIGDDCLANQEVPECVTIDLARTWHEFTKLPFTFAVFAAHRPLFDAYKAEIAQFDKQLDQALSWAQENATMIYQQAEKLSPIPPEAIQRYYNLLQYKLSERHLQGLQRFKELSADVH